MEAESFFLVLVTFIAVSSAQERSWDCDKPRNAPLPFCNSSLSFDARAHDLVSRLTLEEKIGSLHEYRNGASENVDLDQYVWTNEALHGIAWSPGVSFRPPTEYATVFPQIISLAASFNKELFFLVGNAVGKEGRAFHNVGNAGLTFWTPDINIYRDPRWGRGQETPGEDPHLSGEYAKEFVRGMEGDHESESDRGFLKVSACCKHFAAYSLEDDRFAFDSVVNEQDMADTYLPAFQKCVEQGKASCVMCSYNRLNGVPACAHKNLITGVAREQWGFDGYVVSDCGALFWLQHAHHYTDNETETCRVVLDAGVDVECGGESVIPEYLGQAVAEGAVSEEMVDAAAFRAYKVLMRLGYFEKEATRPYKELAPEMVDSAPHQALALEGARQGIVLLKNAPNTAKGGRPALPIDAAEFGARRASMAVIGPNGIAGGTFVGNYAGNPSFIKEPYDEIKRHVPDAEYERGCGVTDFDDSGLQAAEDLARESEQVVLFVGINSGYENEGLDRPNITLPGLQNELIRRVVNAAQEPVILFLVSGGCIDLSEWKNDPRVGAIIWAGYLGQSAGEAMADVMFGTYNPSGRLTQTFYSNEFLNQVSPADFRMRPGDGNPGRTYRFFTGQPVYEFGYGLSYTTFDYSLPDQDKHTKAMRLPDKADDCAIELELTVRNSGQRAGDHSVIWFIAPPGAGQGGRPIKSLLDFARVNNVQPQESKQVAICLNRDDFQLANVNGDFEVIAGEWNLTVGNLERTILVT